MADVHSWNENFYGLAWRTHAGNPIAVPLFVEELESDKIAEIVKGWNPKSVHLTFIEKDDDNYAICIYDDSKPEKNIGLYRSGMSQRGTYSKIKQMIEKKSSMWNPLRVYVQIVHAKDPKDSKTYQNMTDLLPISKVEIISESALESEKFAVERNAFHN